MACLYIYVYIRYEWMFTPIVCFFWMLPTVHAMNSMLKCGYRGRWRWCFYQLMEMFFQFVLHCCVFSRWKTCTVSVIMHVICLFNWFTLNKFNAYNKNVVKTVLAMYTLTSYCVRCVMLHVSCDYVSEKCISLSWPDVAYIRHSYTSQNQSYFLYILHGQTKGLFQYQDRMQKIDNKEKELFVYAFLYEARVSNDLGMYC